MRTLNLYVSVYQALHVIDSDMVNYPLRESACSLEAKHIKYM